MSEAGTVKKAIATLAAVLVLATIGWLWHMVRLTNTYDEWFKSCMEAEKSWQPSYVIPYPSPAWDYASRKCEQEAAQLGK